MDTRPSDDIQHPWKCYPIPESIQGQVSLVSEQPELVGGLPAHGRGLEVMIFKVHSNPIILSFYNSGIYLGWPSRGILWDSKPWKKNPIQWHMSSVLARTERNFGRNLSRFECTRQRGMLDYTLKFLWTLNYWKRNSASDYLSAKISMNYISVLRWLKRDRSEQR